MKRLLSVCIKLFPEMYAKSCFLICSALILGSVGSKLAANMNKIECRNYAPELLKYASCYTNRTSRNTSTLSVEFALTEDLNDIKGHYLLSIERGSQVADYISMDMDYCQLLASPNQNRLIRVLTYDIRKSSNLPVECPFKKNKLYYVKDYNIDLKVLPSYLPEIKFITDIKINFKNKLAFKLVLHGSLVKN